MTFTIRQPVAGDAAAIADVHVSTWRETYAHLLPEGFFSPAHIAGRRRMWADVLSDPRPAVTVRIAEIGAEIIGFAWVARARDSVGEDAPSDREVIAIYVSAAHHGHGAGQALLDAALGSAPAMLWVATANPRAIAFYRRNGFRFDGAQQTDPTMRRITSARMIR